MPINELNMNATTAGINSINVTNTIGGWGISIIIFITIITIMFFISKNLRQFLYGLIINLILAIIWLPSRIIGKAAGNGNYEPLRYFGFTIGIIIASILMGHIAKRVIPFIKKMEKNLEGDEQK